MGMISIEGKNFIGEVDFITEVDNSVDRSPGSTRSFVTDMGVNPLMIRIRGVCSDQTDSFSDVRKAIMTEGELDLIFDSGWKYKVFRQSFRPRREAGVKTTGLSGAANYFDVVFVSEWPFQFSASEITRTHEVIANNETWTTDEDGNAISTSGEVDAVPDIQVTGRVISDILLATYTEYSAPDVTANGLAWDWSNIWSCDSSADKIYKHNADMTVNTEYSSPSTAISGLTWDGSNIWSCDTFSNMIYKHNADMTVNTSYASPGSYPNGLAWDGNNIWSCDYNTGMIYKHNTDMTVNTSYDAPFVSIYGLAWDGSNIWTCNTSTDKLCKLDASMNVLIEYSSPNTYPTGVAWDGVTIWSCDSFSNKIYKQDCDYSIDTKNRATADSWTDTETGTYSTATVVYPSWVLAYTKTYTAIRGRAYNLTRVGADMLTSQVNFSCWCKVTVQAASYASGVETTLATYESYVDSWTAKTTTVDVLAGHNEDLVIKWYVATEQNGYTASIKNLDSDGVYKRPSVTEGVQIYNTSDDTVKCDVCNELEKDAIIKLNVSGYGTIDYDEAFEDIDWMYAAWSYSGVTLDIINHELDIADDGWIEYKFDCKDPITGIPTLTAQINTTSGTPTIQIAKDSAGVAGTYYDIDTAIVDDVETVYQLVSGTDINYKKTGETIIYIRIDCVKAAAATLSIKTMKLDVELVCIDVEFPVIDVGGNANTIQCDQNANSGMNCIVDLMYQDRMWSG